MKNIYTLLYKNGTLLRKQVLLSLIIISKESVTGYFVEMSASPSPLTNYLHIKESRDPLNIMLFNI